MRLLICIRDISIHQVIDLIVANLTNVIDNMDITAGDEGAVGLFLLLLWNKPWEDVILIDRETFPRSFNRDPEQDSLTAY